MESEEETTVTFKCPLELKVAFGNVCERNDLSASQVYRAMMRDYIAKNGQLELKFKSGGGKL